MSRSGRHLFRMFKSQPVISRAWKSHRPPGHLVQINNVSKYHSWSLCDCPEWQARGPQSKCEDSEENDYGDNTDHVRRVLCRKMFPFSEELQLSKGLSEHSKPEVEKLKRFQVGSKRANLGINIGLDTE